MATVSPQTPPLQPQVSGYFLSCNSGNVSQMMNIFKDCVPPEIMRSIAAILSVTSPLR